MDELLTKYVNMFQENFPVFCLMGLGEEEIISIIKECLKKGTPYRIEENQDIIY